MSVLCRHIDLVCLISHSRDMVGAHQNLNGSSDLSSPFQGWFAIRGLALASINLRTKFEVSNSTHYEDMKGDTNVENGVIWGS